MRILFFFVTYDGGWSDKKINTLQFIQKSMILNCIQRVQFATIWGKKAFTVQVFIRRWRMKIVPEYQKLHLWEDYARQLQVEYCQCLEEGKDIAAYEELFKAVDKMALDENKEKMADILFDIAFHAPYRADYPYEEPSDLESVFRLRPGEVALPETADVAGLKDKVYGAWMGRICGCLLGKPVEGMETHELIPLLTQSGNYPMTRYIRSTDITEEMRKTYDFFLYSPMLSVSSCFIDEVSCMPYDDDTNYVVMAQKIIENHGRDFTPEDVAQEWMVLQPKTAYCTAERAAYRNFMNGIFPPESAVYKNPYREWDGAQIRGDYFGYICPGRPEEAARMAWKDASVTHRKNGIYGEMWVASMLAAAAVAGDVKTVILAGLSQIPETCRLQKQIRRVIGWHQEGLPKEICFARIHEEWDEYFNHNWCHTISNAMVVAAALLYSEGDYGKGICLAVETGFDTDCNGATVGSVLGMINGLAGIPDTWTAPVNGTLETTIFGVGCVAVEELVELTLKHINIQ